MTRLPERIFDVAVVGLGPAGATLARLLAERGLDVSAVDRKKRPRHLLRPLHLKAVVRMVRTIGGQVEFTVQPGDKIVSFHQ